MYKLICFLLLTIKCSTEKIFIRNTAFPICSNCLHFIENINNYPYHQNPSQKEYGRCKKFGVMSLITGEIEYDFATICRSSINKCGNLGSEYTEKI